MNCQETLGHLDDYVDGLLSESEASGVERHAATCASCRAAIEALRSIVQRAGALPQVLTPERDLWPGIAAEIGVAPSGRDRKTSWVAWFGASLLAAAALLLITRFLLFDSGGAPPSSPPRERQVDAYYAEEIAALEADYARARQELRAAFEAERAKLDPETYRTIQDNLDVVDNAIVEIRTALQQDDRNTRLLRMLVATENHALELMGLASRLAPAS